MALYCCISKCLLQCKPVGGRNIAVLCMTVATLLTVVQVYTCTEAGPQHVSIAFYTQVQHSLEITCNTSLIIP